MRGAVVTLAAPAALLAWSGPSAAANGWWTFDRNTNLNSTLTWKWTVSAEPGAVLP